MMSKVMTSTALLEDLTDLLADRLVDIEARLDEHQVGTLPARSDDGIADRMPNLRAS
jgi:hypothetical protein